MRSSADDLFDAIIECPDPRLQTIYAGLIGLESEKERISKLTRVLLRRNEVLEWSKQHYGKLVNLASDFAAKNPFVAVRRRCRNWEDFPGGILSRQIGQGTQDRRHYLQVKSGGPRDGCCGPNDWANHCRIHSDRTRCEPDRDGSNGA